MIFFLRVRACACVGESEVHVLINEKRRRGRNVPSREEAAARRRHDDSDVTEVAAAPTGGGDDGCWLAGWLPVLCVCVLECVVQECRMGIEGGLCV